MRMVVCRITVEVKVQATRSALLQHLHRMDESFAQALIYTKKMHLCNMLRTHTGAETQVPCRVSRGWPR